MKEAINLVTVFLVSVAKFIIGVLILAGKADIRTIGYYYVIVSVLGVTVALLGAVTSALRKDKEL